MALILIADDDPDLRAVIRDALRAGGHEVEAVPNGTAALEFVRTHKPDLAVLDYRMGRPDGFEVCRAIKDSPRTGHVPVLILTAEGAVESRLDGFDAGADDYLAKPFDPRELIARTGALLRLARRGLDRNPTSGLPGGRAIERELARRADRAEPVAVCYFDLEHFKPFGDHFGFARADRTIRAAGETLQEAVSHSDGFVGHVGGDDFLVFVPAEEARPLVERVRGEFAGRLEEIVGEEVARKGCYVGHDREGNQRTFRLTRFTVVIVHTDLSRWPSADALGERVAELKAQAKRSEEDGLLEVWL
jgi:PleD family two-component response regulator